MRAQGLRAKETRGELGVLRNQAQVIRDIHLVWLFEPSGIDAS